MSSTPGASLAGLFCTVPARHAPARFALGRQPHIVGACGRSGGADVGRADGIRPAPMACASQIHSA